MVTRTHTRTHTHTHTHTVYVILMTLLDYVEQLIAPNL